MGNLLAQFKEFLSSRGISQGSISNYLSDLNHFLAWLDQAYPGNPVSQVSIEHALAYRTHLSEELNSPVMTVNRRLSSLRKFFNWAATEGIIPVNPMVGVSNITLSSQVTPLESPESGMTSVQPVPLPAAVPLTPQKLPRRFLWATIGILVFGAAILAIPLYFSGSGIGGLGDEILRSLGLIPAAGNAMAKMETSFNQESNQNHLLNTFDKSLQALSFKELATQGLALSDQSSIQNFDGSAENVIQNSSYELNNSGAPVGWQYFNFSNGVNTFVTQATARTGENSLQLTLDGIRYGGVYQEQSKTRSAGGSALSVWIRTSGLSYDGLVKLGFKDDQGNYSGYQNFYLGGTSGWQRLIVSANAAGLYPAIEFRGYSQGTVYLDDWQMTDGRNQTVYSQNAELGQGSILASGQAVLSPILSNSGGLGTATNPFGSLYLAQASIDTSGNLTIGGTTISKQILPASDNTFNLGSTASRYHNLYIDSFLATTGSTSGDMTVAGNLSVTGTSTLTGNVTAKNNLTAAGSITSATLTTTGDASIGGNFSQTGSGTLSTGTGAVSLNGPTSVTGSNGLTIGNGLTLTTGALNLTATSGSINLTGFGATALTSTSSTGDAVALTDTSLNTASANLGNLYFKNANTGAGVAVNGLTLTEQAAATPSSGTNTTNLLNLAASSGGTVNGLNISSATGFTNFINTPSFVLSSAGAVSGITGYSQSSGNFAISGSGTFSTGTGAISLNGNVTLGSGDSLTTSGQVTLNYLPTSTTDYTLATKPAATNPTGRWLYSGSTYTDTGTMMGGTSDFKYYADSNKFGGLYLSFSTAGAGYTNTVQYSKGSGVWGSLTVTDGTTNFTTNGSIYFTPPSDWATDTVNGVSGYWIRFSTGTSPTTTAISSANYIEPTGYALATYLGPLDTSPKFYVDYQGNVQVSTILIAQNLSVTGNVTSSLIPSANNTYNLGSSSNYWNNGYINSLNANNIAAANTTISGTTSETFTLNSDNSPANPTESLIFSRTNTPNPVFSWDATATAFTLNGPLSLSSGTGTATITAPGTINTTGGAYQTNSVTRLDNAGNLQNIGTYTSSDTPAGSTSVDLISGTLTNNTTSGTQRGLVLTLGGSGTTAYGAYINYSGSGTGTTALGIAGTWGTGIATGNNSINAGTGAISGGALTAVGTANINATGTAATNIGNSTGALVLASGGTSSWTNTSGNLTLSTITSGALALNSAGAVNLTAAAASTFSLPSNTASAYRWTDGTNAYVTLNTQTATSGISALTLQVGTAPTLASAAGAQFVGETITPGTYNFTGTTNITGAGTASSLNLLVNQLTLNGNNTNTIAESSNVLINGAVKSTSSLGTQTITNSYALNILAGAALNGTGGAVTNGYGLSVNAPTGAGTNYAAIFQGGNVGIGTATPGSLLTVGGAVALNGSLTWTTDNTYDIGASGATRPRSEYLGTSVNIGTNPATVGQLRVPNGINSIGFRNGANSANVFIGDYSDDTFQFNGNGTQAALALDFSSAVNTIATTGRVRMANNEYIYARNAGNTANGLVVGANSSNQVQLGDATFSTICAGSSCGGKVTAGTFDPLYTIDNGKYATYGLSGIGVKEEISGEADLSYDAASSEYKYVIDLENQLQGSDLWVFSRVTDPDLSLTDVLLTPNQPAKVWYVKDSSTRTITIYADRPVQVSYRLTGARFDHTSWPTASTDSATGLVAPADTFVAGSPSAQALTYQGGFTENFQTNDATITLGDVLSANSAGVAKSSAAYDSQLLGVAVNAANNGVVSVAPAGKVEVHVTVSNGGIAVGDHLTASGSPGYAMKLTQAGRTLGLALQAATTNGTILVEVNPGWFDPNATIYSSNGTIATSSTATDATFNSVIATTVTVTNLNVGSTKILTDSSGNLKVNGSVLVTGNGSFATLSVTGLLSLYGGISAPNGLVVRLGSGQSLSVQNNAGVTQASINDQGAVAGTSIQVNEVKIATNSATPNDNTTGTATMTAGTKQLLVSTTKVTASSKVFVTFQGDYSPATRYWVNTLVPGTSFAINLDVPVTNNVDLTWWIVN